LAIADISVEAASENADAFVIEEALIADKHADAIAGGLSVRALSAGYTGVGGIVEGVA
jgi:hypothetical protein